MAVSSFPVLSSLSASVSISPDVSSFSLNIPLVNICSKQTTHPSSSIIVCSYKSGNNAVTERRKRLLEQYGLDPNEFLSEPSTNRRREMRKTGEGKQISAEDPKPQRQTHKLLQVLGGSARRMKLLSPKGLDVRPMMEVVKGAAFDILQAAGGCPASLRPGRWLDLYSGTGSVGIEAMSRGCSEVHFVEMDPWVVSDVLRPNLESTGFFDDSVIHTIRVENFIDRAEQLIGNDRPFDYISVTPPYTQVDYGVLMGQLSKSALVGEDTFIVVEYPLRTDMLDSCGCLIKITDRRFGRTHLAIYGPKWAEKKKKEKKN
ncbi:putative rRNA methyltransferase YlbH [Benincasa hispida]|uniref:putative rRNA methyltransferase YlbH n=1 Tax=Benincasa hispida TaxID=102211 RepID=UPI0018FFC759|nr:putative rRNA methyltransferase YlbH [Benincasa hispida]